MDAMRIGDLPSARLDCLIAQANLRLAWRMRFSDFLHGRLTLAQYAQLQAECFRAFGSHWEDEILPDEGRGNSMPFPNASLIL